LGLKIICHKNDSIGSIALLFRKVNSSDNKSFDEQKNIEVNHNYSEWFNVLKDVMKKTKQNEEIDKSIVWLIANDSSINGIICLTNCLRLEPKEERVRCIFDYDKQIKYPLDFKSKPFSDILANDLAINVIRDGKLGTYRNLSLPKLYDKIETSDYHLNVGPNEDLSSLQWIDN
jgi:hypothetical protein